ncbi:Uncharacterised protein [Chryseobacterium taklimakanense]|uniref:YtxH domain-containing protein n=1 Tax=Chryseobacterium taklimakanense TaxID=536441 RepID=A0A239XKJ8_9FLAO|nr:DUF6132 family protein [Chryseobacterium taklimakanense]SNV46458.1 Uncharacterised protein [Chryseobacterium taklimakanense]
MKEFITQYKLSIAGVMIGAILGYAYYYFIGCTTGSCAITSKPVNSTVYGSVMAYLLFSVFEKSKKPQDNA